MQDQVTSSAPFLDSKALNVDMAGAFSWLAIIYNIDSRLVVFINDSWPRYGGKPSSQRVERRYWQTFPTWMAAKFSLCGSSGNNWLWLEVIASDDSTGHNKGIPSSRTCVA
jgi:hypothetical protein